MFIKPETKAKLKKVWIEKSPDLAAYAAIGGGIVAVYAKYAASTSAKHGEYYENKINLDNQAFDIWLAQQPNPDSSIKE